MFSSLTLSCHWTVPFYNAQSEILNLHNRAPYTMNAVTSSPVVTYNVLHFGMFAFLAVFLSTATRYAASVIWGGSGFSIVIRDF